MKHSDNELVERMKNGDIRLLDDMQIKQKRTY